MGIKYNRGIYRVEKVRETRAIPGFRFPLGIQIGTGDMDTANSSTAPTAGTVDLLLVAGGGAGGGRFNSISQAHGGGGAGGVRVATANNLTEIDQFKNICNISATNINFIPVTVGAGGGNSSFGSFLNTRGGYGGRGQHPGYLAGPTPGAPGGSGGGGGAPAGGPGLGIAGQGCDGGGPGVSPGGSATVRGSTTGGLTTTFTGPSIRFGDGGAGNSPAVSPPANRGNGGTGATSGTGFGGNTGGGSGIVAIRYRNPAAPTSPLAQGGDCICCTGDCIIHVFNSSGFFNVATEFSIN